MIARIGIDSAASGITIQTLSLRRKLCGSLMAERLAESSTASFQKMGHARLVQGRGMAPTPPNRRSSRSELFGERQDGEIDKADHVLRVASGRSGLMVRWLLVQVLPGPLAIMQNGSLRPSDRMRGAPSPE